MGEIAEAMLDGTYCCGCGEYLHLDPVPGYPVACESCGPAQASKPTPPNPIPRKRVRGLRTRLISLARKARKRGANEAADAYDTALGLVSSILKDAA